MKGPRRSSRRTVRSREATSASGRGRESLRGGEWLEWRLALTGDVTGTFGAFTYSRSTTAVTIQSVHAPSQAVLAVPASIEGLPVTSIAPLAFKTYEGPRISIPASVQEIGAGAFSDCKLSWIDVAADNPAFASQDGIVYDRSLTRLHACPGGRGGWVTVPWGVKVVGRSAFAECSGIAVVELPTGLTTIEGGAFSGCLGLSFVALPDTLTTIGDGAFFSCKSLVSMAIPASVTAIGPNAFEVCTSLRAFDVADGNTFYADTDGALLDGSRSRLIACPPGLEGAFTIPDGVTVIGENAFLMCPQLTEVTLPASLTLIENGAFASSYRLERLNFLGPAPALGDLGQVWGAIFVTTLTRGYRMGSAAGWPHPDSNRSTPVDAPERYGGMIMTPVSNADMAARVAGMNHAPIDVGCSGATIEENRPVGTVVGEFAATDPDADDSCTFAVVNAGVPFTVEGGRLVTTSALDFESATSYLVQVRATDERGLSTERMLRIDVANVDETPTFSTVTPPEQRAYRAGDVLTFTVASNQPVVVTGSPVIDLTIGTARRTAVYASGSGTGTLVFTYRVKKTDAGPSEMALGGAIRLPSRRDTLQTNAGDPMLLAIPGGVVPGVTIDTVAPQVTRVLPPAPGTYATGSVLRFLVTFGESVTVSGRPTLGLALDRQGAATAAYTSGSGGRELTFEYVVRPGDAAARGPRPARAIALAGGTIRDAAGNPADLRIRGLRLTGVVIRPAAVPS